MSRARADRLDYAGPSSRVTLTKGRRLGPRWVTMPKICGSYVHLNLDSRGRVASVLSRTGQPYRTEAARSMIGVFAGYPGSELVGELDDHTQAGLARFKHQGFARVSVFDVVRVGREYVAGLGFGERRSRLMNMIGDLENTAGLDRPWVTDSQARAHDPATGRYCRKIPKSWRRLVAVPMVPARQAEQLWDEYVEMQGGEGLVFCHLDAPIGRRGGKAKAKPVIDLDCVVHIVEPRRCVLHWVAGNKLVVCSRGKHDLAVGRWVTILCDGFYDDQLPKHPRIVAVRTDRETRA